MNDYEPSPSAMYCVSHDDVERVFQGIPPRMKRKPRALRRAIRQALAVAGSRIERVACGGAHPIDVWLAMKIQAYANSPEGKGKYWRPLDHWLRDGGYDEPAEAWQDRGPRVPDSSYGHQADARHKENVEAVTGAATPEQKREIRAEFPKTTPPHDHRDWSG